uniref:Uncharacterized protein n=1 Tax=Tanacetum cinerariifolium TaxID=118510 RepID=A0A6L2M7F7_TANCI|nr:hypothetical protein [Tanacetum cinerariifolium]
MISNEYAVKFCLEHEVKRGNKVVKKELIVAQRGEIYFVKFVINPEEDDLEPGVIFGRSFLRMTKAVTDFRAGTVTIYPKKEDLKKINRGITMINHTQAEAMGILTNVLGQVRVTTLIAKFLILDIPIDRDPPIVVGWGFLRTIGAIVNTPKRLFLTFDGFCHQTFLAARSDVMRNTESDSDDEEEYETMGTHDDEARSLRSKRSRQHETIEEICAFNINEPIYVELCHEFYLTYEFDEVCADDELKTKKIIKFRLGVHAHNLTLLDFAQRLGLYHADELEEDGFNIFFEGGYEHVVMNCGSTGNMYLHSPLMFPAIKQLAIKWWDEYGFVIHPVLAPSQSALFPTFLLFNHT